MSNFDGLLYINARGWKLAYNIVIVLLLWLTGDLRDGHWYFDAESLTEPKRRRDE